MTLLLPLPKPYPRNIEYSIKYFMKICSLPLVVMSTSLISILIFFFVNTKPNLIKPNFLFRLKIICTENGNLSMSLYLKYKV